MGDGLIRFYASRSDQEAQLVMGVLEGAGVDVEMRGQHLSTLGGGIPFSEAAVVLWIPASQLEVACAALGVENRTETEGALSLADTELGLGGLSAPIGQGDLALSADGGDGGACPDCGAEREPGFGACWSCSAELDA